MGVVRACPAVVLIHLVIRLIDKREDVMISRGKSIIVIAMVIAAFTAKGSEFAKSFADDICKAFADGDKHKVIGYTMDGAKTQMSNSLDVCSCWFMKFKGREMLAQFVDYRHYYSDEVLKSVESVLQERAELYVLNLIAFPTGESVSCRPMWCCLHFMKDQDGVLGLLGNVCSGPLITRRDVDMLFNAKSVLRYGMSCENRSFSDNPYLWRNAKRIQDSLNADDENQIRLKLLGFDRSNLSWYVELWRIVSSLRHEGQEFRVIPRLYLYDEDSDVEFAVWSVKSGSYVGLRPTLSFRGRLNEDGSCSIKSMGRIFANTVEN